MSTTVRESSHVSRKYRSHGGGGGGGVTISGQGHSGNTSSGAVGGNTLENNLDALLEDLQTSVSRSTTPNRGARSPPRVEYRSAANTSKTVSEVRAISPTRTKTTTTEKFISTGPAGVSSGIPGLEALDAELRNVQPGQSKTVAYKQVSYQYNKNLDGKPIDSSYSLSDNSLTGVPLIDDIHETSYEETRSHRQRRSPEPINKSNVVNRELLFDDNYTTSRSRQTSPLPGTASQSRDLKFVRESSSHQSDLRGVTNQEYGNVEYVPVPSPTPAVPINLAPGPKTKVTTTIKTYTYELPGSPESYLPSGTTTTTTTTAQNIGGSNSTLQKNVHLAGDQTITYTLPRGSSLERPVSPVGYRGSPTPEITQKSQVLRKEAKYYHEEYHGVPPGGKPGTPTKLYAGSPPQTNVETTLTRNDYYRQTDGIPVSYVPIDQSDHPGNTTIIYQNQEQHQSPSHQPIINETHTTTLIDRTEEHYLNGGTSPIGRPDAYKSGGTPPSRRTPVNYYASPPLESPQTNTTIYKYSNTTTVVPPTSHPDDREVLLPKPFPTGVQVYPSNGKPLNTRQTPPAKLEDLMASFSDSEREVLDDIAKQENYQRKDRSRDDASRPKKEVDFVGHTPPQVKSKNVAGPPVYYPPGSAEFTKKESAEGAMSQSGGAWQKGSGKYEYEASSKSKTKSSSGAAVVPICLPLCCGLPCVIM